MERTLVFLPISTDELAAITGAIRLTDRTAYRVTPELLAELGYEPRDAEDAEYAALVLASVAALARYGARTVLVAEVENALIQTGEDLANGECHLAEVPQAAMTCWFTDEAQVDPSAAAGAATGKSIDEAWEQEAVQELIQGHQLLWNDVEEYRRAQA